MKHSPSSSLPLAPQPAAAKASTVRSPAPANTPNPIDGYKSQLRELKRAMKREGVRRISCFNGGITPDESRYNTEIFRLEALIKKYSTPSVPWGPAARQMEEGA